jgi:hypothetical protein
MIPKDQKKHNNTAKYKKALKSHNCMKIADSV